MLSMAMTPRPRAYRTRAEAGRCSRSFTMRMWASLLVRMAWHGAAPPAGGWRGRGVRVGGVVVSLT
jgi:hypothetical protein